MGNAWTRSSSSGWYDGKLKIFSGCTGIVECDTVWPHDSCQMSFALRKSWLKSTFPQVNVWAVWLMSSEGSGVGKRNAGLVDSDVQAGHVIPLQIEKEKAKDWSHVVSWNDILLYYYCIHFLATSRSRKRTDWCKDCFALELCTLMQNLSVPKLYLQFCCMTCVLCTVALLPTCLRTAANILKFSSAALPFIWAKAASWYMLEVNCGWCHMDLIFQFCRNATFRWYMYIINHQHHWVFCLATASASKMFLVSGWSLENRSPANGFGESVALALVTVNWEHCSLPWLVQ